MSGLRKAVSSFPILETFVQRFASDTDPFSLFCRGILIECVREDKLAMVDVYISLYLDLYAVRNGVESAAMRIRNAIAYSRRLQLDDDNFIDYGFIDLLAFAVREVFQEKKLEIEQGLRELLKGGEGSGFLGCYLRFFAWPCIEQTRKIWAAFQRGDSLFLIKRMFPSVAFGVLREIFKLAV